MEDKNFKVVKVFNNNVVLALQGDTEKILFGKGIGFGRRMDDIITSTTPIDKIFAMQNPENLSKFNELMDKVDEDIVSICEEIISFISGELKEDLDEKIHISLTDHISFTLKRLKENDEITNPFLIETETLFRKEFQIALKSVEILEKRTGIHIPDGEAGFIALHIHSARNKGKLSNTIKYAFLANSITEMLEDELNLELDKASLDYARFIVHLRFAIERIMNNSPIRNELLNTIKRKYKASYKLAQKAAKIIESNLELKVATDEIGYIAIHVEKLKTFSKETVK